jgi:hypothetical protein
MLNLQKGAYQHTENLSECVCACVCVCVCTRSCGVLADFTAMWQSRRNMAWTGNKKALCVLKFAKPESIVTVQRRFRTVYRVQPARFETDRPVGAIGRDCRAFVRNVCQVLDMSPKVDISSTCKVGQKRAVSLPLLTYSPSA